MKELLRRMRTQVLMLQNRLKYCSPLGSLLRDMRRAVSRAGPRVGPQSIRRLEEAGIHGLDDLMSLTIDDLVRLGVRRNFAEQIRAYMSETEQSVSRL